MIGSLGEFISVARNSIPRVVDPESDEQAVASPKQLIKKRGKTTFQNYVPQDKTDLLIKYERNNIFQANRRKYHSIVEDVNSREKMRKPLVQHKSFFIKPEIARDYIAKEELKRKHNLLRAIMRMKQTEEEPKGDSDYQQSFQRLYSGFRAVHPQHILEPIKSTSLQESEVILQKDIASAHPRNTSSISHRKRIQYEHCLSWAKKHNKNGDFFAKKLGKSDKRELQEKSPLSRILIDQISKKIEFNLDD